MANELNWNLVLFAVKGTIQVDLSGENSKKIKDIIIEIFHNLAMRVKVRSAPEEGSSVAELVAELRQLDCLFFDDA